MQRVLVTGANKGIGLEIAKDLLDRGVFVFMGSRDAARGKAAADAIIAAEPGFTNLLQVKQ